MVENGLQRAIEDRGRCPSPRASACRAGSGAFRSRRASRCAPTKGQRWLLSISASDRAGLLYLVARVLARATL